MDNRTGSEMDNRTGSEMDNEKIDIVSSDKGQETVENHGQLCP